MLGKMLKDLFRRSPAPAAAGETKRLHLGCGKDIRAGWINLDASRLPGVDVVADLDRCAEVPLPFADSTIEEFFGSHVLEHVYKPLPLMQELHRIAKPGAIAVFRVPYGSSDDADEDPTHVRRMFPSSFHFFSQLAYSHADYGYRGDWEIQRIVLTVSAERHAGKDNLQVMEEIRSQRNMVIEMIATLMAVKPPRAPGSAQAQQMRIVIERVSD